MKLPVHSPAPRAVLPGKHQVTGCADLASTATRTCRHACCLSNPQPPGLTYSLLGFCLAYRSSTDGGPTAASSSASAAASTTAAGTNTGPREPALTVTQQLGASMFAAGQKLATGRQKHVIEVARLAHGDVINGVAMVAGKSVFHVVAASEVRCMRVALIQAWASRPSGLHDRAFALQLTKREHTTGQQQQMFATPDESTTDETGVPRAGCVGKRGWERGVLHDSRPGACISRMGGEATAARAARTPGKHAGTSL